MSISQENYKFCQSGPHEFQIVFEYFKNTKRTCIFFKLEKKSAFFSFRKECIGKHKIVKKWITKLPVWPGPN